MTKRLLLSATLCALTAVAAFAGDPRDDNSNPEPGPTLAKERIATITHEAPTNAAPQQLESARVAKLAQAARAAVSTNAVHTEEKALEQKAVAIILRNVYAVRTPQGVVLVDRDSPYLRDLTNIYPHQLITKLALTEP